MKKSVIRSWLPLQIRKVALDFEQMYWRLSSEHKFLMSPLLLIHFE